MQLLEIENQTNYLFGGKAVLTLKSLKTNKHFTFKIKSNKNKSVFFVMLLNGPSNTNNYIYLGTIFNRNEFRLTKKSKINKYALSYRAFNYYFKNLISQNYNKLKDIEVFHNNRCSVCGRLLTTPESIKIGIGPICLTH